MLTRILTSLAGVIVFFAALYAPEGIFAAAIFAVTAIMLGEMYKVLKCSMAVNIAGAVAAALIAGGTLTVMLMPAVIGVVMLYLIVTVVLHGKNNAKDIMAHGFVTVFITLFMCFIIRTMYAFGEFAVLLIFIIAWMTDTGAYFTGYFFGKHKLAEHISPKKTVEGAVGGVLVCVAACVLYRFIIDSIYSDNYEPVVYLAYAGIGFIGSLLAQTGDFIASCIKRDYNIKDYGNILPGHGGLMDRFDSVVFIAPYVYAMVVLMSKIN